MIVPPWAYAAAAGLTLAIGFGAGWTVQGWRCDAAKTEALERAQRRFNEQLAKQQDEAEKYEHDREASRAESRDRQERIREIYRTVEVPGECAAPDAVRGLLDDAVRRANARAAGESPPAVPGPSAPAEPAG